MEVLLEGVEGRHLLKGEMGEERPWPCDLGANQQEACWPVLLLSDFSLPGCHSQLTTNFSPVLGKRPPLRILGNPRVGVRTHGLSSSHMPDPETRGRAMRSQVLSCTSGGDMSKWRPSHSLCTEIR